MDLKTMRYMELKEKIKKCEGYMTQGWIGLFIGIISFLGTLFLSGICIFGIPFLLIGIIMLISNSTKLSGLQIELELLKDELDE
jgi:hypothetical protein